MKGTKRGGRERDDSRRRKTSEVEYSGGIPEEEIKGKVGKRNKDEISNESEKEKRNKNLQHPLEALSTQFFFLRNILVKTA